MNLAEKLNLRRDKSAKSESYVYPEGSLSVDAAVVGWLKDRLVEGGGSTIRVCLHAHPDAPLHEMIVVHCLRGEARFQAHKHLTKEESYHMIEGRMRIDIYREGGQIETSCLLGEPGSDLPFLYRIAPGTWHSTTPETKFAVFKESRPGPFDRTDNVFPGWDEK